MPNNLGAFAFRMRTLARGVEVNSNNNTIRLAATIELLLVMATPVDTGHARANWQVGIEEPPTEELSEEDTSGQATIARAAAVLSTRRSGQAIYIANNVKYLQRLNEGWSAQAPAGFVEKSINAAIQGFRNSKVIK